MRGNRAVCVPLWTSVLMWLWCGTAGAQEAANLTLEDAIARALAHSARLAELEARQAGAEAAEAARESARKPFVAAQAGYVRTNHVDEYAIAFPGQPLRVLYPDVPDNYRARLDLQWALYTGGRAEALSRAAGAEAAAVAADVAAARADLRLEVTRAFWALVTARETEQVVTRAVERMDVHLRDLRSRLQQGLILPSDVTAAEAQRSRQHLLAIEARNIRRVSEADLRRLIGATGPLTPTPRPGSDQGQTGVKPRSDLGQTGVKPGSDPGQTGVKPGSDQGLTPGRPERTALDRRLDALQARERAARAGARPQIAAVAGYDYARPNPRIFPRAERWEHSWDIGVNFSWTLWDGGRRQAEQAEAAAATRVVEARITEFDRQTAFEIQQRELELESARAAIDAAADGIRSASETLRVLGERYRAGVATSTEVLDAEFALLQAELDRTRAIASARLADARLERARGR